MFRDAAGVECYLFSSKQNGGMEQLDFLYDE